MLPIVSTANIKSDIGPTTAVGTSSTNAMAKATWMAPPD